MANILPIVANNIVHWIHVNKKPKINHNTTVISRMKNMRAWEYDKAKKTRVSSSDHLRIGLQFVWLGSEMKTLITPSHCWGKKKH